MVSHNQDFDAVANQRVVTYDEVEDFIDNPENASMVSSLQSRVIVPLVVYDALRSNNPENLEQIAEAEHSGWTVTDRAAIERWINLFPPNMRVALWDSIAVSPP